MRIDKPDWTECVLHSPEQLQAVSRLAKAQGHKVVTTNGCFDLLHRGHIHTIKEGAKLGGIFIIGLNSDESVRANKGPKRPLIPESERAEILLAFEGVDYVYIYGEDTSICFVELAKPDIHINAAFYGEDCIESAALRACGARLHMVQAVDSPSTTDIIRKVQELGSER